jgi:hypothetical protein
MFGSAVLDLVIGLVFTFLAVSLAVSAITEMIASITKWRSVTLRKGMKDLLNDPNLSGLGRLIYEHGLVNPLADGTAATATSLRRLPGYIDPENFAHALMDVTGITETASSEEIKDKIDRVMKNNPQINVLLKGIVDRAAGGAGEISEEIARWFDTAMDRVSGAYKRGAQRTSFIVALVFAAVLNISAVHVAERLWEHPIDVATITQIKAEDIKGPAAAEKFTADLRKIDALSTSIGWENADKFKGFWATELWHPTFDIASRIVGWLITALAALFGAPFWFDALQQIIRLKGAGPSPQEKREDKWAAA